MTREEQKLLRQKYFKKQFKVNLFRKTRSEHFKAFDIYKTNLFFGVEHEVPEQHQEVVTWYQAMCDFPDQITEDTTYQDYPVAPEVIRKYL